MTSSNPPMQRLTDRVALVTGATGGIGAATARRFVAEGAKVFLTDLDAGALAALADELGDAAAWRAADVSDEQAVAACVAEAVERFGGLHVLFANAGSEGRVRPLAETAAEDFRRVLEINVLGVFYCVKHATAPMLASGGGSMIVTSSVAGFVGSPGLGPYCSSKHAVMGLVKTAAQELGPQGVRVNSVNPGPIDNRMMQSIEEQAAPGAAAAVRERFSVTVPLGRYGRNEEIASIAAFLASDDAAYCNGTSFVADGGMLTA